MSTKPDQAHVRTHTEKTGELDADHKPYEWTHRDIRDFASEAHRILEIVLPKVLPRYSNPRTYLKDKEAEQPSPEAVVQLALDFAVSLHVDLGRVLLCVDEVALYLRGTGGGFDADRVREIQGLAETVKNKGKGKVFLFATAQLRVDTIDGAFAGLSEYVVFLKDRFPAGGRLEIEERDIDTVVRERWLKKDASSAYKPALEKLIGDHGGLLASAAKLRDESLIRDTSPLTDADAVLAYYPCLPFHIRLLQAMLEALRGEKQIDQTAAQSRALLTTIRALFVSQNGANLADAKIGSLVTFDKVYDVIRDVVRRADSATDQWIAVTIESLGTCGAAKISSVAKVIFLLQHLNPQGQRRVRVSAENVAALLYPRLGAPWEVHLKDVREACAKLLEEHFVGEEPETGYRFYRAEEQSFQRDVAAQPVDEGRLRDLLNKAVEAESKALGLTTVIVNGFHKLDVSVQVHGTVQGLPDPLAHPMGLALHFLWPKTGAPQVPVKLLSAQYAAAKHLAICVLASAAEAEDLARRLLKLEGAINDYASRIGQQAATFLKAEQVKLNRLKEEMIPQAVRTALTGGVVIHGGVDTPLATGKRPQDLLRDTLSAAVDRVYPQLEDGCVQVDDPSLRKVLTWRPPQPQPEFMIALKLFDDGGQPLLDRPFLKEVMLALQGRSEAKRTGRASLDSLSVPPYGWPERAVKAGFGALLRARRLTVRLSDGSILRSEADPKAEAWLTGTQAFNKSVLDLSEINITQAERRLLTDLFADVFRRPGLDTVEKLEREGPGVLSSWLRDARESLADLRGRQLPGADAAGALATILQAAVEPDLIVGKLKQLAAAAEKASEGRDPVRVLKEQAEVVEATASLREQGKLDRLANIRSRTITLYPAWIAHGGGDALVAEHLAALRVQVAGSELLYKAEIAFDRDRRCFEAYAKDYLTRFRERHQRAMDARARLREHPAWPRLSPSRQDELLAGLAVLDPDGSGELTIEANPEGREEASRATHSDLAGHLELIDAREQRGLRLLDAVVQPPVESMAPSDESFAMDVLSVSELPRLFERITELAQRSLNRARRVRVTFEEKGE